MLLAIQIKMYLKIDFSEKHFKLLLKLRGCRYDWVVIVTITIRLRHDASHVVGKLHRVTVVQPPHALLNLKIVFRM